MVKKCTKCGIEKQLDLFNNDKSRFDGKFPWCRECKHESDIRFKHNHPSYRKQWYKDHPDYNKKRVKDWFLSHPDYRAAYNKKYFQENKVWFRTYEAVKRKNNINYRLGKNLRRRLCHALVGGVKSGSAVRDLGCAIADLKTWLESQFQPGMSWDNYGKEWHIDHIIPLSTVDLSDRKQLLKVCNWFNLRPLWAEENFSRGNRI